MLRTTPSCRSGAGQILRRMTVFDREPQGSPAIVLGCSGRGSIATGYSADDRGRHRTGRGLHRFQWTTIRTSRRQGVGSGGVGTDRFSRRRRLGRLWLWRRLRVRLVGQGPDRSSRRRRRTDHSPSSARPRVDVAVSRRCPASADLRKGPLGNCDRTGLTSRAELPLCAVVRRLRRRCRSAVEQPGLRCRGGRRSSARTGRRCGR